MIRNPRSASERVQFVPEGASMTQQGPAFDADVNVIVAKYVKTGDPSIFRQRAGEFLDTSLVGDYFSCLNRVKAAQEAFATLPSKVREAFGNDPGQLELAMRDPARRGELVSAGIVAAPPVSITAPGAASASAPATPAPPPASGTTAASSA